jgi:hypothetical protein
MLGVAGILTQALVYQPITDADPKERLAKIHGRCTLIGSGRGRFVDTSGITLYNARSLS